MRVGVIGINHKLADLSLRELLAKAFNKCFKNHPYVLLSTCNRIELYFSSYDLAETHSQILCALKCHITQEFDQKLYSYFNQDCFFHLSKVTAGFDSAILLETEIQGQVKSSYEQAIASTQLPSPLHYLFQKSLKISKSIRSKYALGRGMPDIEHAIFQTGSHYFKVPKEKSILFVGFSSINQKVLEHLKKKGCDRMTLCNRSLSKAIPFSKKLQISLLPLKNLHHWFHFDWIIVGTKAPYFLISEPPLIPPNPKLIIDLSLPRNVDPKLGQEPKIQLLNIDQINRMLKFRRKTIDVKYSEAEQEICQQVNKYSKIWDDKLIYLPFVA